MTRDSGVPMKSFKGKRAVVTGGGTGMGRELARQLSAEGCSVAICDVSAENMAGTKSLCEASAPAGARITTHLCDVADEKQVLAFRDAVAKAHGDHVHLLFNNAGIGGGGSFVAGDRAEWERTFAVCWGGVYNCTRAFLPLVVASPDGYIVNTSSVNGFWASIGPGWPHSAYCSAKFAVKGFSEALIEDLRVHAPHVKVAVVMPGHIGTSIVANTRSVLGKPPYLKATAEEVAEGRGLLKARGLSVDDLSDDEVRQAMHQFQTSFEAGAPLSAAGAATIILDGVRAGRWRILVGEDARLVDEMVRRDPENAYEGTFWQELRAAGHFGGVMSVESPLR
jgi:NAD(P)-dependent dehydrogenase (short-subunit alcohol dehydrogenase family)